MSENQHGNALDAQCQVSVTYVQFTVESHGDINYKNN